MFWLGQEAADEATDGLAEIIESDEEDIEVRRQAIFALSQQENERAIPLLIDIARSPLHPELRRQAFFWLADSDDERVIDFFEEILTGS